MTWVVQYKMLNSETIKLAKLTAENYSDASDKAVNGISTLNNSCRKYNQQFELIAVTRLTALESWDD